MLAQIFMSGTHGIVSLHIARGKDPWVKWRPVRQQAATDDRRSDSRAHRADRSTTATGDRLHMTRSQAMTWIALRMLMGDRAKYFGLIFGVTFATLLMTQQVSIFMGIMTRTASQILDVRDADIWVMDNKVRFIDEVPALPDTDLHRVRGVPGVEWAVRMYKGQVRARLADGNFRNVVLFGLDDATLVGARRR